MPNVRSDSYLLHAFTAMPSCGFPLSLRRVLTQGIYYPLLEHFDEASACCGASLEARRAAVSGHCQPSMRLMPSTAKHPTPTVPRPHQMDPYATRRCAYERAWLPTQCACSTRSSGGPSLSGRAIARCTALLSCCCDPRSNQMA